MSKAFFKKNMIVDTPFRYQVSEENGANPSFKKIEFKPANVTQAGDKVNAEDINGIQENSIYEVEAIRVVEGVNEFYDIAIAGINDFTLFNAKLLIKFNQTNTKANPQLRILWNSLNKVYPIRFLNDFSDIQVNIGDLKKEYIGYINQVSNKFLLWDTYGANDNIYDTMAQAQIDLSLVVGDVIETLGFYTKGDGGGHKRIVSTTDDGSGVACGSLWLNYINLNGSILALHFGLKGDNSFDNTVLDTKMHNYAQLSGYTNEIIYDNGNYISDLDTDNYTIKYTYNNANVIKTNGLKRPSYSEKLERLIDNEEYAWHWLYKNSANFPNILKKIVFAGDSTTAGVWSESGGHSESAFGKITDLFERSCSEYGLGNFSVLNGGISGSTTGEWSVDGGFLDSHISAHADMNAYVIRYGLNDALTRTHAQFKEDLENGLIKLRNFKNLENLTIVLMTPNSSFQGVKNEKWLESITHIIKKLAKKYKCVYIDTYGILKDARSGFNIWNDYIHPDINHFGIINTFLEKVLLEPLSFSKNKTTNFFNIPQAKKVFTPNETNYEFGISLNRATLSSGFPFEGIALTMKHADGVLYQVNTAYNSNGKAYRTGLDDGTTITWNPWKTESDVSTTLTTSADFTSQFADIKNKNGAINLVGYIVKTNPSVIAIDTLLGTVPDGYKPTQSLYTTCTVWDGTNFKIISIAIGTDGAIYNNESSSITCNRIYFSNTWFT